MTGDVVAGATTPDLTTGDTLFAAGAERGVLLVAECAGCQLLQHPPSPMCPRCGSVQWVLEETGGRGTVVSWIVSRHPSRVDEAPRIVALVELEEGVRLVSNIRDATIAEVSNDMPVEVAFLEVDGVLLPQFVPARGGH
jgi:uncharacterized protein